ncbi:DUF2059 domain-containing protein [Winogradskyella sp. R77965]|uniref:DUF2059 domain-containing protein n=1 Tax=Winogradskyella sp. R77965 TaxID=3093872 RepID=UPI0037DC76EA
MRRNLLIAFLTIFTVQIYAQSLEEKIINLLELDGTFNNIDDLIDETIEQQKKENIGVSDQYWEALKSKVSKKSLNELKEIVVPIYTQIYSESNIDNLITFYSSETGKLITEKQPIIIEKLSLGLMQWSQNLNSYVIEEIDKRGENQSSSEQLEKFESEFKSKYGLQILNMTDLSIDQEHNIGDLLVDFGRTNGEEDITKIIRVKNNSNLEMTFEEPTFLRNDAVKFDLGDKPLKPGDTRDLEIILLADQAENRNWSMSSIDISNGNRIQFGIKYDAPAKEISYEISDKQLKFKKLQKDFSKPYVFTLTNTGKKDFYISDIELDKQIAYLSWNKETIRPNEQAEIRVVFSRQLIEKDKNAHSKLKLEVDLTKGEKGGFSSFPNETIELIIK